MEQTLLYQIAFSFIEGVNDKTKKLLLLQWGTAINVYQACVNNYIPLSSDWPFEAAKLEMDFIAKHGIEIIPITSTNYPNRLLHCEDAPSLLYCKVNNDFNKTHLISIVGTRNHSFQAQKIIETLLEGLAHLNLGIISGLARGIDGLAHQTATQLKIPTWGVLAHGLDSLYPAENRNLAIEMLAEGGLLTEFKKNSPPLQFHFPKRNRIVAGMSDATIVIESPINGGSMITADLAFNYNREVFAVPGKLSDKNSQGCLSLIKNNKASMYHDPIHLLECLAWEPAPIKTKTSTPIPKEILSPELEKMLSLIALQGPINPDQLSKLYEKPLKDLPLLLLILEMKGLVYIQAGNHYAVTQ
jgi:DNA processing protein